MDYFCYFKYLQLSYGMLHCNVTVNKSQTSWLKKMVFVLGGFCRDPSYTHIWNCKVANPKPETLAAS